MRRKMLLLLLGGILFILPNLTIAISPSILINEIQITGGEGKTAHDFVELYNPTDASFNLKGHRLVKRTKTGTKDTALKSWTTDAIVPAGGYYLWASNSDDTFPPTIKADAWTTQTLANDNGVALREGPNDTGTVIDSVAWGAAENAFVEGTVFPTNPGVGESLGRVSGQEIDNNATDFAIQKPPTPQHTQSAPTTPSPTTGSGGGDATEPERQEEKEESAAPTSQTKKPTLAFSEILPNPFGSDEHEFVEIENKNDAVIILSGWRIKNSNGQEYVFLKGQLFPSDLLSLSRKESGLVLQNDKEKLELIAPETQKPSATVTLPRSPEGQSRIQNARGQWIWTTTPTPGAKNVETISDRPPVIVTSFPKQGAVAELLTFDASDSYSPDREPLSFLWDFGDGYGTASGPRVIYLYPLPGTFTITLTVIEERRGLQTTETGKITIKGKSLLENQEASEQPPPREETKPLSSQKETTIQTPPKKTVAETLPTRSVGQIEGVVTVPAGILAKTFVYLECLAPCAGEGVKLRMTKAEWPELRVGDIIRVSGTWTTTGGEPSFLTRKAFVTVTQKKKRVVPRPVTLATLGKELINLPVTLTGEATEKKGTTIYLDDGTDEIAVEIQSTTHRKMIAEGDEVRITGILVRDGEKYKLRSTGQPEILTKNKTSTETETRIVRERNPTTERRNYLLTTLAALLALGAKPVTVFIKKRRKNNTQPKEQ